jgi:endonuclease/exonuclease/phosphatase (EEP) superfamily protein YafD
MSAVAGAVKVCLAAFVAVAIAGLLADRWWLAELLVSLRVQQVLVLLPVILLCCLLRLRRWWLVCGVAVFAWHLWWLRVAWLPEQSSVVGPVVEAGGVALSVCTVNVRADNPDLEAVLASLRDCDADVIAVVELTSVLRRRLESEFSAEYPHFVWVEREPGHFGIGLLSRYPLGNSSLVNYRLPSVPSIEAVVQLTADQSVHVIATHPRPPMGLWQYRMRNEHLQVLADRVRELRGGDGWPVIVLGDLNLTPWSPIFGQFQERAGLRSAAAGDGLEPTWYSRPGFAFGLVIDHVLYTEGVLSLSREILGGNGSDHRPVRVALRVY